jgi:hypothetical protein
MTARFGGLGTDHEKAIGMRLHAAFRVFDQHNESVMIADLVNAVLTADF